MDIELLPRVPGILFPVFVVILIGYGYGRRYQPELASANQLNMRLFVPALGFDSLKRTLY